MGGHYADARPAASRPIRRERPTAQAVDPVAPAAAPRGEAPLWFAGLRAAQMPVAAVGMVGVVVLSSGSAFD